MLYLYMAIDDPCGDRYEDRDRVEIQEEGDETVEHANLIYQRFPIMHISGSLLIPTKRHQKNHTLRTRCV